MTAEIIYKKIDKAISTLDNIFDNYEEFLESLEYILFGYQQDYEMLSKHDGFSLGFDIRTKLNDYYNLLATKYANIILNVDLKIVCNDDKTGLALCRGAYNPEDNTIYYSNMGLLLGGSTDLGVLQTFFHEMKHLLQTKAFQKDNIDDLLDIPSYMIDVAKDHVISDIYPNYYRDNYNHNYIECDAELFAEQTIRTFLDNLSLKYYEYVLNNNKTVSSKVSELRVRLGQIIIDKIEEMKDNSDIIDLSTKYTYIDQSIKYLPITYDGREEDKLLFFRKVLSNNYDEAVKIPILRILFNDNHQLKSYDELINEWQHLLSIKDKKLHNKIHELYSYIIKADPVLFLTFLVENNQINLIKAFLEEHPTFKDVFPLELEEIINRSKDQYTTYYLMEYKNHKKYGLQ